MDSDERTAIVVDDFTPSRRSLRLAVTTETYPPEVNGVATTVASLVAQLRARGHEVQLVRPRQPHSDGAQAGNGGDLLLHGVPIPRYPQLQLGLPARRALLRQWSLKRPDLVHVCTEGPLGWSAVQAARQLRLPVTSDFRTNFHAYSGHYGVGWLARPILSYLRKFHNRCDSTMVPTERLAAELRALRFAGVTVVGRGVDRARFDPSSRSAELRRAWRAEDDTPVALYVGRLAPEKNLGLVLEAYAAMRGARPDTRLVLVGDGPERAALQARCPQAIFAGMRHGTALAQHYASADVFLFASLTETYGNVTAEALASGLAVVAFDHAAAGQLIRDGSNGRLAPPADRAAFVACARELAADDGLRARLRAQAGASVRDAGWEAVAAQVEAHWLALLGGRQAAIRATAAPASGAGDASIAPLPRPMPK
ncbi:MAG: glycosyltransferase family 4 protein [Betaproteobacteria bacterium]